MWSAVVTWLVALDYGTVPDWLSASGTLIAILALIREVSRARRDRLEAEHGERDRARTEAQDRREEHVRQVTGWLSYGSEEHGLRNVTAVVSNAGISAIFDIVLSLEGAGDVPSRSLRVVPPQTQSRAPEWIAVRVPPDATLDLVVRFQDSHGVWWVRRGGAFVEAPAPVTVAGSASSAGTP